MMRPQRGSEEAAGGAPAVESAAESPAGSAAAPADARPDLSAAELADGRPDLPAVEPAAGGRVGRWWRRPGGRLVRAGAVAVVAAVLVGWWVHDDGAGSSAGAAGPAGPATPPPAAEDLDQLAAAAGCRAEISAENTGYRQAVCRTPAARLVLTTFSTDQGQRDWLSDAIPYGGAYLVGLRWVVNGTTPAGLPELAAKLGGTIVDKSQEHGHP